MLLVLEPNFKLYRVN